MNELATYIVSTLKDAGVNTVLQKDYLANVGHGLIQYLTIINSLGVLLGMALIGFSVRLMIRARRADEFSGDEFASTMGCTIAGLVGLPILIFSAINLLFVMLSPELAIINYLK